jgi:hypothetical protein
LGCFRNLAERLFAEEFHIIFQKLVNMPLIVSETLNSITDYLPPCLPVQHAKFPV